jgi:competence protein ComEC
MRPLVPLALAWLLGLWVPGGQTAWLGVAVVLGLVATRWRPALYACAFAAAHGIAAATVVLPAGNGPHDGVVVRPAQLDVSAGVRRVVVDVDGIRVQVSDDDLSSATPLPGDRVRFRAELERPRGWRNPGVPDRARLLAARGIDALANAEPPGIARLAGPAAVTPWRLAATVQQRLAEPFRGGDGAAIMRALVLGDRRALPPSLEEAFRLTGTSHVLSVSGLHLAAVAGLAYALSRRGWRALLLRRPRLTRWIADADRAALIVAAPIAVLYALVTGAELATLRALACVLLYFLARLLGRRPDALSVLAAAAMLLTALNPAAAHDASFQLTFAATATLVVATRRLAARAWPVRVLGVTAAVWCVTAPISAVHFGALYPLGLVANAIIVPIAELLLLPAGLAAALLGPLWSWPAHAASFVAGGLAALVRALGQLAPVWEIPPPTWPEGICLVALFLGRTWLLRAVAVAGLAVSLAWTMIAAPALATTTRVTFLDVGQGDAALIETPGPTAERWLVDAGGQLFGAPPPGASRDAVLLARRRDPGEQAIWPFLRARRIFHLDVVVISHPHPDHMGGLPALLEHVSVGEVWIAGEETDDPAWHALLADLDRHRIPVVIPPLGEARRSSGAVLTVLAAHADPAHDVNDNSLVVRVDFAGERVLFAGDLESPGEARLLGVDLRADVVKVPHHGSRTSSSAPFVAATRPRLAIISCGEDNLFGFPSPEVVARWRSAGAVVRSTAEEGAISLPLEGHALPLEPP